MTTRRMPAVFLGHGSPMNALDDNLYTRAWRRFGESVPRPRAGLAGSVHWYVNATALTAMERPETFQHFYGFRRNLFDIQYPAPRSPGETGSEPVSSRRRDLCPLCTRHAGPTLPGPRYHRAIPLNVDDLRKGA